ncbi:hypothetical protein H6F67_21225 [Microcoleus sp. FACHB-1515]|uniref:hypothetical protein n=1 Tax=Cyanophyceae TaxID=3028117 RepID=UPI00168A1E3D|nr:hypothetical protein [Microcoleus sp. FACHB-1515]MBD2092375.1 hypothetical protein [Microcoleus sp. FACHB-1515]
MKLTLKHQLAILGGSVSTVGAIAFCFGYWTNPTAKLSPLLLSYALGVGSVAAVAVARDRSGELKLEVSRLKAALDRLQAKLDEEYQDKQQTTQAAIQAQNKVEKLQERVGRLQADLDAAEGKNQEWMIAANQTADAVQTLKAKLTEAQSELDRTVAHYQSADRKENHIAVKQQVDEIRSRLVAVQNRKAEAWQEAQQQKIYTELGKQQARVDELVQAVDRLTAEVEQLTAENEKLIEENKQAGRDFYAIEHEALPKIQHTYETDLKDWESQVNRSLDDLRAANVQQQQQIAQLEAPRLFRGGTSIDDVGNRIIKHFGEAGVIFDAIESVMFPGGWRLKFKVDRNADSTRLAQSELDKHREHLGLWGLSQRPLDFVLDTRNFIVSVDLFSAPDSGRARPASAASSAGVPTAIAPPASGEAAIAPAPHADRFQELGCYSAAEFESVVRLKFVPRVRVVAGSTGGKSPLLELITCAIARSQGGEIWLINPIPGSPKDWFHIPGVIAPGCNGIEAAIAWLGKAHQEFEQRRNDLPGAAEKHFITVMVDEINAIARDYAELGTVMKDFYQLSDHTKMGFLTAGQGGNVSGVSGGSKATAKTGNAAKLMEEDFQNATQVFTAAAAKTWIKKQLKGVEATPYLDRLSALNRLCEELNEAENKSAYPRDPATKKVSPDAYRIALVVSPREAEPFFIQLPPYSSYRDRMAGISYPKNAIVTAPQAHQVELGLLASSNSLPDDFTCVHCGHHSKRRKGTYADGTPKYVCSSCSRATARLDAAIETPRTDTP